DGMVVSIDFPVLAAGAPATKTWTLAYDTPYTGYSHPCGGAQSLAVNLQRLKELRLPSDLTGAPKYPFAPSERLTKPTLPTGGTVEYCYGGYTFFHGRAGAVEPNCPGIPPPADALTTVSLGGQTCPGVTAPEPPLSAVPHCTEDNEARWVDSGL